MLFSGNIKFSAVISQALGKFKQKSLHWMTERYPVSDFQTFFREQATKLLPKNVSWWHTFGSLALFLLTNQIITGILLMVYYRPTPEMAFESVKFITTKARFGWLIRSLHAWGANLMIIAVVLHMFRTFVMGAFKKPREITWCVGVALLIVTLSFGFTGYLLPWNQLSYWATTVGTEVAGAIPYFGKILKYLFRGGETVGAETLSRFYVTHVIILPWVITFMVSLHIFLMRLQGLSPMEPVGKETPLTKETGIPFFPDHILKELVVFPLFFLVLLSVCILFPVGLGEKANPFLTPVGIKPEWYFLPNYQLLKYFPKLLGIITSMLPILILFLWPFLDQKNPERRPRKRPISITIGVSALLLALFFGVLGYFSEREVRIMGKDYHIDLYGIPHRLEKREKSGQERSGPEQGENSKKAKEQEGK